MEMTSDDDWEVAAVLARGLCQSNDGKECSKQDATQETLGGRTTVMTNLSRGNTATATSIDHPTTYSLHQLAARGEMCQLQEQLTEEVIDDIDEHGYTPLMWAALYDQKDVVNLLLSKGACVNMADPDGITPLMMACSQGSTRVLDSLLSFNSSVNKQDKLGRSALMFAASANQGQCARHLLQWGIDATLQNMNGLTAMDIAVKGNHVQVQETIEKYLLEILEGI